MLASWQRQSSFLRDGNGKEARGWSWISLEGRSAPLGLTRLRANELTIVMSISEFVGQVDRVAVVFFQQSRIDQFSVCLRDLLRVSEVVMIESSYNHIFPRPSYPSKTHRLFTS